MQNARKLSLIRAIDVGWIPLHNVGTKLNNDKASQRNLRKASNAMTIWNHVRNLIVNHSGGLRLTSNFMAKLNGMSLILIQNLLPLVIELDIMIVIHDINFTLMANLEF